MRLGIGAGKSCVFIFFSPVEKIRVWGTEILAFLYNLKRHAIACMALYGIFVCCADTLSASSQIQQVNQGEDEAHVKQQKAKGEASLYNGVCFYEFFSPQGETMLVGDFPFGLRLA